MSKRQFKSQASSARAGFGQGNQLYNSAGSTAAGGFVSSASPLSYLAEQPELSTISDPNVVVALKNISKKDSTTKAKALDEIQLYLTSIQDEEAELETAFIEAWIKVYPRLTIDASRRVRQGSHQVLGKVAVASGKRAAKYMPKLVGAWLAGVNDPDKLVSRAAQDALEKIFTTAEKRFNLKMVYQASILEFCRSALVEENPKTLSDERSTTSEEAEAIYARVVSCNIALLSDLVIALDDNEVRKQRQLYEELLGAEQLWELISSADSGVRRNILKLLGICLREQQSILYPHLEKISTYMLAKKTIRHQSASSVDFTRTLWFLAQSYPEFWTISTKGETSALGSIQILLKHGSQGGSAEFWKNMSSIIREVPELVLPKVLDGVHELSKAAHNGVTRKDEPRSNAGSAWETYFDLTEKLMGPLTEEDRLQFVSDSMLPLFEQYLLPKPENIQWDLPQPLAVSIIVRSLRIDALASSVEQTWPEMMTDFIDRIKTSSPEQSKDFQASQTSIASQGLRWFALQSKALDSKVSESLTKAMIDASCRTVTECLEIIRKRNGKPYGAAATVDAALQSQGDWLESQEEAFITLKSFLETSLPSLVLSPSQKPLFAILYRLSHSPNFESSWHKTMDYILQSTEPVTKSSAVVALLQCPQKPRNFRLASQNLEFQHYIQEELRSAHSGQTEWSFVSSLCGKSAENCSTNTTTQILSTMTENLRLEENTASALTGLQTLVSKNEGLIQEVMTQDQNATLLKALLKVQESSQEDNAQIAGELTNNIESVSASVVAPGQSQSSLLSIIHSGLFEGNEKSLTIDTLVDLGQKVIRGFVENNRQLTTQVLPSVQDWELAIKPFLSERLPLPLAVTTELGDALYLVDDSKAVSCPSNIERDVDGFASAARIALYTVRIIKDSDIFKHEEKGVKESVYRLILLSIQLVNDKLGFQRANSLWLKSTPEIVNEMAEFVSQAQELLTSWQRPGESLEQFVIDALEKLRSDSTDLTYASFHSARAFSIARTQIGPSASSQLSDVEATLKQLRGSMDILSYASYIRAYSIQLSSGKSIYFTRIFNELIADLTGLDVTQSHDVGLKQLVLLNLILTDQEDDTDILTTVAKQRLVFFFKHAVGWLKEETVAASIKSQTCKILKVIAPHVQDVYGDHWSDLLEFLSTSDSDDDLPLTHNSLRLYASLKTLTLDEECNEDLQEALTQTQGTMATKLVVLFKKSAERSDESDQPQRVVNELLARLISILPPSALGNLQELYPLINADSSPVRKTAFQILHRQIPRDQEQLSVDKALDKSIARLPDELLSLILTPPDLDALSDANFERELPLLLFSYLASWLLIFDHFRNASDKLKSDYATQLKEDDHLAGLLAFTFDFLGHSSRRPVDPSKFELATYSFDIEPSPLRDAQWLLTHLYYLCLKRLPSLTKTWWINLRSRQLTLAVETWTEKYLSPLLISDALGTVGTWAATNWREADGYSVKVNTRAKELSVSKEIDEQQLTIVIQLPARFPLAQASVIGVNRVAVEEKKWRSWLLNIQGVIAFSDNSLVEGLVAFRRNVDGQLKGHTECAICYSIVSQDKQLPTKKCGTCNNFFHGSCLYRWFKSSNSSSCPLCRTAFNYA